MDRVCKEYDVIDVLKHCECMHIFELSEVIPKIRAISVECSDMINRSHFKERVRAAGGMVEEELSDDFKDGVQAVLEMLKTEPSVAIPRIGHWIEDDEGIRCSECGTQVFRMKDRDLARILCCKLEPYKAPYCYMCGAKMEEPK